VTQREENERIQQEFISIVSHELRTPVTAIKGRLGLLTSGLMDDDADKIREMQRVALNNTNRLHLLINDILDVDKLESGRQPRH
jgi:signal transduction histidine kinase